MPDHAAYRALIAVHHWLDEREPLFSIVKYLIFALLGLTSFFYILADVRAAAATLGDDATFWDTLSMYAISVDIVAWLTLLVIYELETSVIDDEDLTGAPRFFLLAVSALCYVAIFYALAGYLGKLALILDHAPFPGRDVCAWTGPPLILMQALDAFVPVAADNCAFLNAVLAEGKLRLLASQPIVFDTGSYYGIGGSWSIAWSDAIEAVLWILVVGLIQLEILLQMRGRLGRLLLARTQSLKAVLYVLIIIVTTYYSLFGRELDLWDSVLWLLAFLFIEINITQWNEQTRERSLAPDQPVG